MTTKNDLLAQIASLLEKQQRSNGRLSLQDAYSLTEKLLILQGDRITELEERVGKLEKQNEKLYVPSVQEHLLPLRQTQTG